MGVFPTVLKTVEATDKVDAKSDTINKQITKIALYARLTVLTLCVFHIDNAAVQFNV